MFKKLFTISLSIILIAGIFYAREITFNEAQIVAENWTRDLEQKFGDQVRVLDGKPIYKDNILVAHVFNLYPKGYVIISPQDYLPAIKMYSTKNNIDTVQFFVDDVVFRNNAKFINKVRKGEIPREQLNSGQQSKVFEYYIEDRGEFESLSPSEINAVEEVAPLVRTTWGQGDPYNKYSPYVESDKAVTGCTPTAFAQILNYWEYPSYGQGSESYYDNGSKQTLSTNFNKEYKWWLMKDSYNDEYTDEESDAVAQLMFDLAVALHSKFSWYGTGTGSSYYNNISKHFKYSSDMQLVYYKNYNNIDLWFNVAKNQIDNKRPVKYGIWGDFGHSAVIDGYRIENESKMVHINMGGTNGSYYAMDDIGGFPDFKYQDMFINIYPYVGYQVPIALPPTSISGEAKINKSVFLSEYIITVNWNESPSGDIKIDKYIVYQNNNGTIEIIGSVDPENKTYEFRSKELYKYSVGILDKNNAHSDIPGFITPVIK